MRSYHIRRTRLEHGGPPWPLALSYQLVLNLLLQSNTKTSVPVVLGVLCDVSDCGVLEGDRLDGNILVFVTVVVDEERRDGEDEEDACLQKDQPKEP